MNLRKFRVVVWSDKHTHKVQKFVVDDTLDDKELNGSGRPSVAEFPVCDTYPEDQQRQRAIMFQNYMNKIVEATERAYEETMLMDVLKQPAAGQTP